MTGRMVIALVAMLLAARGAAAGPTPVEFRNGEPSTFGSVQLPVYQDAPAGEDAAVSVALTLHPEQLRAPAARYLIGFNLKSDIVRVHDVTLTAKGKPLPIERDDRGDPRQPRLIIPGDALPGDRPVDLQLSGRATTTADGQAHVGVLAIAFDASWGTLRTEDGAAAQAYAFTMLMSTGHPASGLAPRFQGMGNAPLALLPLLVLAIVTGFGLRAAKHRLYPPPPRPPKPKAPRAPAPARSPGRARPPSARQPQVGRTLHSARSR